MDADKVFPGLSNAGNWKAASVLRKMVYMHTFNEFKGTCVDLARSRLFDEKLNNVPTISNLLVRIASPVPCWWCCLKFLSSVELEYCDANASSYFWSNCASASVDGKSLNWVANGISVKLLFMPHMNTRKEFGICVSLIKQAW